MESTTNWATQLLTTLVDQLRLGIDHLPRILGAIIVLLIGWLLARVLRRASKSIANASNRVLLRVFPSGILSNARMSPFAATIVGEVLFWGVFFLTITAAVRVAGLSTLSEWLDRIAIYLPNLMAAGVIVGAGYLLSIFVRQRLTPLSRASLHEDRATFPARAAQAGVIVVAITMGLGQIGIDVILPASLLVVAAATVAVTFGISFALGARSYMSNLIGMRSVRGQLTPGLAVRVDGIYGHVIELSSSQLLLETEEGRTLIPGRIVNECVMTILASTDHAENNHG